MRLPETVDLAIVGAGTAGAAAAALCADRGLRVLCLERGPLEAAGARWVNGVPASAFERAGLPPPCGEELLARNLPFHLVAGFGPERLLIEDHGLLEVDMRRLVARLQELARERGAVLAGDTPVLGLQPDALLTGGGRVRARWIVDASGLAGARLLARPEIGPAHLCVAAQQVRRLRDPAGARAFFERHHTPLGEVLCFSAIAGGYSILNLRCEGDQVALLTGSVPGQGHPSGLRLLEDFVAEQGWIGELRFGGSRAVPLRRPFDRLTDGRVALLGDAGAQVFSAHGSGIGPGLIAARVLADALAEGAGLEGYAVRWQRAWGGLLAAYDVFRRFSQALTLDEVRLLMRRRLLDGELARFGLAQELPLPSPSALPGKLRALASEPRLGARLAAVVGRMAAVTALYAAYPSRPRHLPAWGRAAGLLFAERPDRDLRER